MDRRLFFETAAGFFVGSHPSVRSGLPSARVKEGTGMAYGYNGKILRVNLSSKDISTEEPDDNFYRRYMGGRGFIGHYMLKELKPKIDPLGPDNKLIFATGVINT